MELMLKITALCAVSVIFALALRKNVPELALLLVLMSTVTILMLLGQPLRDLLDFFRKLGEMSGLSEKLLAPLYKTVGIALVVKIGSGLCKDAGESVLASVIELSGAVCALLTAIPLMETVLRLLVELL